MRSFESQLPVATACVSGGGDTAKLQRHVRPAPVTTAAALSDDDLVDVLRARAREAAVAAAGLLSAVVALADSAVAGFEADEVAFALAWTHGAARRQVDFGRYLTRTLPDVLAALRSGDIDTARAWVFYDQLAPVDDALAAQVAAPILSKAPRLTTSQLRDRLRRAILTADPEAAAARTRHSEAERYVATSPDSDGTASLYGVRLPAARTMAAFERVDAYARARRRGGDSRGLDQLRADTFLDLLEGTAIEVAPIHRTGVIELTIPWDTAVALGDEPATLAGYGPIPAAIARDLIDRYGQSCSGNPRSGARMPRCGYSVRSSDGTLLIHRTVPSSQASTTAQSNQPVAYPPVESDPARRTPGVELARWIVARDRTCRAPGCQTLARAADIDHTTDHAAGGPTTHENLALLCRHHHRAKHEGGWTVSQPHPGHLRWTSPSGNTYLRGSDPPW